MFKRRPDFYGNVNYQPLFTGAVKEILETALSLHFLAAMAPPVAVAKRSAFSILPYLFD